MILTARTTAGDGHQKLLIDRSLAFEKMEVPIISVSPDKNEWLRPS
jgi:hypothetical protein